MEIGHVSVKKSKLRDLADKLLVDFLIYIARSFDLYLVEQNFNIFLSVSETSGSY